MTSMYLEWAKLLLSSPAVALYLGLLVLWLVRRELPSVVARISKFSGPGVNVEVSQASVNREESLTSASTAGVPAPAGVLTEVELDATTTLESSNAVEGVPGPHEADTSSGGSGADANLPTTTATTESEDLAAVMLKSEKRRSQLWEFRYFDRFLVPRTQGLLKHVADSGGMTIQEIDALYATQVPPHERYAMIQALLGHHLVLHRDGVVRVTDKGTAYLYHRRIEEVVRSGLNMPVDAKP
jgi:hypothetical protein